MAAQGSEKPFVLIVGYDRETARKIVDEVNGIGCTGFPVLSHEDPLDILRDDNVLQPEIVVINFWLRDDGAKDVMRSIQDYSRDIKIIATIQDDEPLPTGQRVAAEYVIDPMRERNLAKVIKEFLQQSRK